MLFMSGKGFMRQESLVSFEQKQVIESLGRSMAVIASAGSGKTTTIVQKCLHLVSTSPAACFVAVSFTQKSTADLKKKLIEAFMGKGFPMEKHWIFTIHGLCAKICQQYPVQAGISGVEKILSESHMMQWWLDTLETLFLKSLPEPIEKAWQRLCKKESVLSLKELLTQLKRISDFGGLPTLRHQEDSVAQDLVCVFDFADASYTTLKNRKGYLDFSDLEKKAFQALQKPEVQNWYHKTFDLILVDEFQDTNPLQSDILMHFSKPDLSNLCIVGDPKQSIYRFRDADISIFNEVCQKMQEKKTLTTNFRSTASILDFINTVCKPLFENSTFEYLPLKAFDQSTSAQAVIGYDIESPEEFAAWVSQYQQEHGLQSVALLMRTIKSSKKWLMALSKYGIALHLSNVGHFWEDPCVRELVHFLIWWDNPLNTFSGAVFLRSVWMCISDRTLDAWVAEDPTFYIPFFASSHPLVEHLKKFTHGIYRPGQLLLALLENPAIEQQIAVACLGLWHRVEEMSQQHQNFHQIVEQLQKKLEASYIEPSVPCYAPKDALYVFTIHAAKGLEFEHVLLLDFEEMPKRKESEQLFWDRQHQTYLGKRDAKGKRDRTSEKEVFFRNLESQKSIEESKRLFYVALTRAKKKLSLFFIKPKEPVELLKAHLYVDYWRAWVLFSYPHLERKKVTQHCLPSFKKKRSYPYFPPYAPSQTPLQRARHSVTELALFEKCPRAYEWQVLKPEKAFFQTPDSHFDLTDLGSKIHTALAQEDFDFLEHLEQQTSMLNAQAISKWYYQYIGAKNPHFIKKFSELSFEIPVFVQKKRNILLGSIDLIIYEQNRVILVDYKYSNSFKPHYYSTAMQLYRYALQMLDPQAKIVQLMLLWISPHRVKEYWIDLPDIDPQCLIEPVTNLANGLYEAKAYPTQYCFTCRFQSTCDAALKKDTKHH